MESSFVLVGAQLVNLSAIAAMHWEHEKLWVHLAGGRFTSFVGTEAKLLWEVAVGQAVELKAGKVKK